MTILDYVKGLLALMTLSILCLAIVFTLMIVFLHLRERKAYRIYVEYIHGNPNMLDLDWDLIGSILIIVLCSIIMAIS